MIVKPRPTNAAGATEVSEFGEGGCSELLQTINPRCQGRFRRKSGMQKPRLSVSISPVERVSERILCTWIPSDQRRSIWCVERMSAPARLLPDSVSRVLLWSLKR